MPSAITQPIADGEMTSGKEYILRCARLFGALMHMREDSLHSNIELLEADTRFYDEQIAQTKEQLHIFENTTLAEAVVAVENDYQRALKSYKETLDRKAETKDRYLAMLAKVEAWEPPTAEHKKLKDTAIQQLNESIERDCDTKYLVEPVKEEPQDWLDMMIVHYKSSINYYERRKQEMIERVAENNKWITNLIGSLKGVE